jgi:hypothetical protein
MRYAAITLLLLASVTSAQPLAQLQPPPGPIIDALPPLEDTQETRRRERHAVVAKKARDTGLPVVLLVGVDYQIDDALIVRDDTHSWGVGAYVTKPSTDGNWLVYVKDWKAPKESDNPWLPKPENTRILALLKDRGVPVGKNLKFYSLNPVYQKMYTMNNGRSKFNDITPVADVDPWRTSGGMHHISSKEWRNVTGLDLSGPIAYWQEDTDVRAFSLVPKWRWEFPTGTLAYDVLFRIKNGKEHVFEVRVQEKNADGWDTGTTYRPSVSLADASRQAWTWTFASEGLDASSTVYTAKIDPRAQFVPTRAVVSDGGDFTPPGYLGAGMSCNSCHAQVGQLYDVPGRIYREARRGDDGRFSWHPFAADGSIDHRWSLVRR